MNVGCKVAERGEHSGVKGGLKEVLKTGREPVNRVQKNLCFRKRPSLTRNARCPPRHIPVAAIRPLQLARFESKSIDSVQSYHVAQQTRERSKRHSAYFQTSYCPGWGSRVSYVAPHLIIRLDRLLRLESIPIIGPLGIVRDRFGPNEFMERRRTGDGVALRGDVGCESADGT